MYWRVSKRVATARNCLSLLNARSTVLPVAVGVEAGWAAAGGAASAAVGLLVGLFRDGRGDAASAQLGADGPVRVGLVAQQVAWSGPRSAYPVGDAQVGHPSSAVGGNTAICGRELRLVTDV
jgi:hypothetical protein